MFCSRKALLLVVPLVLTALGGCGFVNLTTAEESVKKTFPIKMPPKVIVETFNGTIDVTTDPEPAVKVEVVKRASGSDRDEAEDNLEYVEVTMTQEGDTIHIVARMADRRFTGNYGADVQIQLPADSVCNLKTSNGKVNVAGPTKNVTAQSSNGKIDVKGARGQLDLKTSNGSIQVEGGTGKVGVKTSNGSITIASSKGEIDAGTTNGSIQFTGPLGDGEHTFHTSNGKITLSLPADSEFNIDASTSNSSIKSDFKVEDSKGSGKKHLHGRVGDSPRASVKLHTSNGSIQIRKEK